MEHNPLLNTDAYKFSHYSQYPQDAEFISSYLVARRSSLPGESVVFLGLGAWLATHLRDFRVTVDMINHAQGVADRMGIPFNRAGWEYIRYRCDGHLPLKIVALQEGAVVPIGTPLLQIINTDPTVPWLASYLETSLLRAIWYPSTVGTLSREIKRVMIKYLGQTDSSQAGLPFMLNDFGARGVSSLESAALGGFGHLTQFDGTDNVAAVQLCEGVYHGSAGASVIAAEHSTVTSWGPNHEADFYSHMLDLCPPGGIVAVVSDTYDINRAVSLLWGTELKEQVVLLGQRGGRLVIRPDSGDPVETPLHVLRTLVQRYREYCTTTRTGHIVLPPFLRVIQGDGVNLTSIEQILRQASERGYAAENFVFGMGGALLQQVNRDTLGFAMKASAISRRSDPDWEPISKTAIGKESVGGLFYVDDDLQAYIVDNLAGSAYAKAGAMRTVYEYNQGDEARKFYIDSLERIRENCKL